MLIINDKYAIKNDGICHTIYYKPERDPKKDPDGTKKREYRPKWYLNTLSQAICFLTDRAIDIPSDLKTMSKAIEAFKKDIKMSLEASSLYRG